MKEILKLTIFKSKIDFNAIQNISRNNIKKFDSKLINEKNYYEGKYFESNDIFIKEIIVNNKNLQFFEEEIILIAKYRNPKLLDFYGISINNDEKKKNENEINCWLIFELLKYNLEYFLLEKSEKRNLSLKIKILKEIIEGIYYLHQNDIIHGNLKPSKILLANNNSIRIIKNFSLKENEVNNYSSPEFIINNLLNFKNDIWSFGCLIYYILSENTLFTNLEKAKTLFFHEDINLFNDLINEKLENLKKFPIELIDLLKKCLSYEFKNRPKAKNCFYELKEIYLANK